MAGKETFESLLAAKEGVRAELRRCVDQLTPDQLRARPLHGGWSVREILEHLATVESQVLRAVELKLAKAEQSPGSKGPRNQVPMAALVNALGRRRIETNEKFLPTGERDIFASLETMGKVEKRMRELLPRLVSIDATSVDFTHPQLGSLNLGQWFAFIGIHESRHFAQIVALIEGREREDLEP